MGVIAVVKAEEGRMALVRAGTDAGSRVQEKSIGEEWYEMQWVSLAKDWKECNGQVETASSR